MSKIETLSPINASYTGISKLNSHLEKITAAFQNTISRDGSTPNTMRDDLDLNSNQVINLGEPSLSHHAATKNYVDTLFTGAGGVLSLTLPQFHIQNYKTGDNTWQAALDLAVAAATPTGGVIYFHSQKDYFFTGYPGNIPSNVHLSAIPGYTEIWMPSAAEARALFQWAGSLGASFTLNANVASGNRTITLTSTTGLVAGDLIRLQRTPGGSITLGKYTQYTKIEEIAGNVVTLEDVAEFACQTSDTYTIREVVPNVGGGATGFIFNGSLNTTTTLWCAGIYALYGKDMYFDKIGGRYMCTGEPMNSVTQGYVIKLYGLHNTQGLNELWSYKSGSGSSASIQFQEMGPTSYGKITCESPLGFGYGWYDCVNQYVDSIIENNSRGRSGKMQCVLGFSVNKVKSGNAQFTGFAATEGSQGHVGTAVYHATDIQTYDVASLVRSGGITTITFSEPVQLYNTGHQIVVAGATGASSFNGQFFITRVGTTGNVYTYTNAGVDETAGGFPTATTNRSPSLWTNNTGVRLVVNFVDFRGVTNAAGDVHTGSTDNVRIGVMRTEGGFTPTYGGTAGGTSQGTGRHIAEINGVNYMPNSLSIGLGGLNMAGQLTVTHTGAVAARFTSDNFQYVTALSNAATSGSNGFAATVKDSGGTNRTFTFQNAAGLARLVQGHTDDLEMWVGGARVARYRVAGSSEILNVEGNVYTSQAYHLADGITAPTATAGRAKIYVDTADGDLKIIFGDGTVKTIVTDT
jgi:hypothetical protein